MHRWLIFHKSLPLDVGIFFLQQDFKEWRELPEVEISALLWLTLKGGSEPASKCEIANFSKRETPVVFLPKKKKKRKSQKYIHPEYQSPEIIHITLQLWQETKFLEFEASESFHCASVTAIDMGDNNLEGLSFSEGLSLIFFKMKKGPI